MKKVYVRNGWKRNPDWPGGLEPDGRARKHTLARDLTETEAQEMCREWNATHKPGPLVRKAEYTEQ